MTNKVTQISKEALAPVVASRNKAVELAQAAEQAMKEARLAELEFKVQIQQLYIEKSLDINCRVDISTGDVTWPEEVPNTEAEAPPATITRKRRAKKDTNKEETPVADAIADAEVDG